MEDCTNANQSIFTVPRFFLSYFRVISVINAIDLQFTYNTVY
jgi:hypothetical protein